MVNRKSRGLFQFFQPNDKDTKNEFGDCSFRALCGCLGLSWLEVFDLVTPICRKYQCWPDTASLHARTSVYGELGLKYHPIKIVDHHRQTVEEFAKAHPHGRYICRVSRHLVAVVDGKYWDSWDSGRKAVYGYYCK